ncbi:hypothetical protein ABB37_04296 [Leptomonas pyrrhocoris]|uniref:Uncharacterized protein n=1 Tax=Leptomonas pyrrhocoris TaxID=157538 RepID=A0A0N0DVU5_LEPPY|nr:hypothetical protein ABB37_04296 [Leptomonas pyrrhocoris]XP_015659327.1 hypothetical protein ABB37_04296 [Leptomonas pyrrhocoris]XP_015659328.1 hypothetical protein ABB37_04296 [Leptomonas pyrrhocoris]KPA80887.1 hypothetical protein ABB37_04296 [Leptomonas pyrrhocoris]KPA80888.1 hypothetical protein ABB37_04296 [Leptomonas pyrrhocoris]KPA80889.1 hypothetical protein ABB37_04296 [Leptomonas pyrrhocoris]|eukprot:XP_015659326.1 hypothetical protein ABB37_04296 [Leptomonas pyrrhocoris]
MEHQRRSSGGLLLKINGTQLQSAVAKQRKRRRAESNTDAGLHGDAARDGDDDENRDWPTVVLAAFEAVLCGLENQQDSARSSNTATEQTPFPLSALKSLSGIELRHCELQARHIDADAEAAASLTPILLSPSRLWSRPVAPSSPAPLGNSLTTLDLECNLLGDDGVERLCAHLLPRLPHLQRLLLASNRITTAGFLALLRAVSLSTPSHPALALEVLGLTNNAVGGAREDDNNGVKDGDKDVFAAWSAAVQAFARCTAQTLRRVHLNHASLTTREAAVLIDTILQHTCAEGDVAVFEFLYLRENKRVSKEEVMQRLHEMTRDAKILHEFIEKRVSW